MADGPEAPTAGPASAAILPGSPGCALAACWRLYSRETAGRLFPIPVPDRQAAPLLPATPISPFVPAPHGTGHITAADPTYLRRRRRTSRGLRGACSNQPSDIS